MSLQREAIVRRLRDLLLHRTAAEGRVVVNRVEPDTMADLPQIAVFGLSETPGDELEETPRRIVRKLKVSIEIKVADVVSDEASLALNLLGEVVERIVLRDPHLPDASGAKLTNDLRWAGCELLLDANSRAVVAGLALALEADYVYEPENVAPAHVRDFLGVDVDFNLPGEGAAVDAQDDVTLPGP